MVATRVLIVFTLDGDQYYILKVIGCMYKATIFMLLTVSGLWQDLF